MLSEKYSDSKKDSLIFVQFFKFTVYNSFENAIDYVQNGNLVNV